MVDPQLLSVVALLSELPAHGLLRSQVGTVVEHLNDSTVEVEFSDDEGRPFTIVPVPVDQLLPLHYTHTSAAAWYPICTRRLSSPSRRTTARATGDLS